jgi:hypothetical protein
VWTAIVIIAIISVILILAVRAALIGRRQVHEPEPVAVDPAEADRFPAPGEPAPRRADGSPVPGSRDDRVRKRRWGGSNR